MMVNREADMDDAAESVRDFLTSERYRQGSRSRHSDDLAFIANRLIDSTDLCGSLRGSKRGSD